MRFLAALPDKIAGEDFAIQGIAESL